MSVGTQRSAVLAQREGRTGYLLVAPTTVLLGIFYLYPLVQTIAYSFTNWDPSSGSPAHYVGLANFRGLLSPTGGFRPALWHTAIFIVFVVPLTMAFGLAIAAMLDKPFRGRATYRALIFAPFIAPTVGSAFIFTYLLSPFGGLVNSFVGLFGVKPISFLVTSPWAMVAVIAFTIWHQIGFTMIIYSAALSAIPPSYYEAASLDGAGVIRRFVAISMPLVLPTTGFLAITGTISSLQVFTQIQVLTKGGPLKSTTTALYWIYEEGFVFFHGGPATAGAVMLLLIGVIATVFQLKGLGRREPIELS